MRLEQINILSKSMEEHEPIIQAIQNNLPDEADRLLHAHIMRQGGELRSVFAMYDRAESGEIQGTSAPEIRELSAFACK
jgi:DNA-binding GntR family transcriptional regulator